MVIPRVGADLLCLAPVMQLHLARCLIQHALACHPAHLTRRPQCLGFHVAEPRCLTCRSHVIGLVHLYHRPNLVLFLVLAGRHCPFQPLGLPAEPLHYPMELVLLDHHPPVYPRV